MKKTVVIEQQEYIFTIEDETVTLDCGDVSYSGSLDTLFEIMGI